MADGVANTDAVNVEQLKAAGLNIDTSGVATNAFVAYDDTTKGKVTLGGGTVGTTITNVKAGTLSASSTDAVNGSQLYATNTNVTNVQNTVNNIRQADPPAVSTGTASGVVGTPASQFHPPAANTVRTTPPPPPSH